MQNIIQRTITGVIYISIIITTLLIGYYAWLGVTLLLSFMALKEFYLIKSSVLQSNSGNTALYIHIVFSSLLFLLPYGFLQPLNPVHVLTIHSIALIVCNLHSKNKSSVRGLPFDIMAVLYIPLPLYALLEVHLLPNAKSLSFALALFIFIWVTDTFAYLTGMLLGKNPIFERVSPKKTWEGFVGGTIFSIVTACLLYRFYGQLSLTQWIIFGLLASIASVYGDFAESFLKRAANLKDSGTLLKGHGGVLDRIDSLLFAGPVIFVYLSIII